MNFFKVNESNIKSAKIQAEDIDVMLMVKAMKSISKDYPTMDDLNGLVLIFVSNSLTVKDDTAVKKYKMDKQTNLYIAKINEEFVVDFENEKHYLYPKGHVIANSKNKETPETIKKTNKNLDNQELLALNWFQTGSTGISSKTMCLNIFPNVRKHLEKMGNLNEYDDTPYDNSDFKRCMNFVREVNVSDEQLLKMKKVNKKWSNLVDSWQEITNLIQTAESDNLSEAYRLIKNSINITTKNKM